MLGWCGQNTNAKLSSCRVIDVGSEWRTFSNDKAGVDPSRVGGPENPLLSGGDLSTMIGPGTGPASFDAFGSKSVGCCVLKPVKRLSFSSRKISEPSYDEQLRSSPNSRLQGNQHNGRQDQPAEDHRRSGKQSFQASP